MGVCVYGNNRVTLAKVKTQSLGKMQYVRLALTVILDDGPINIILLVPKQLGRTPLSSLDKQTIKTIATEKMVTNQRTLEQNVSLR